MLAVPLVGLLACVEPMLRWFGTDARAIPHAAGYVYAMCFGMPAMLVFLAHRYTSEGIGWTRPVMYTAVVGLSTNIAGNWLFTLGGLGIPSQGARGCGIATALACWAMLATMHFLFSAAMRSTGNSACSNALTGRIAQHSPRFWRSACPSRVPWSRKARCSRSRRSS